MRFVVDAQLPPALAEWLRGRGHEAFAVRDIGMRHADDEAIRDWALREGAIIVTKDEDFVRPTIGPYEEPQVLWVRTGNVVNRVLFVRFSRGWIEIETHLAAGAPVVELR